MTDPFYIQWHITNLCNLRCQHCYQNDFSGEKDLDWEGLKRIADHLTATLKGWGRPACIHLTGGEPLLKPEMFFLLNYLDQSPQIEELGIITNGLLLDGAILRELSSFSKLKKIKISLDGANAETNDSIRGRGVFERTIQSISLTQKDHRFEVILMFTVMKRNVREVIPLLKLSHGLKVKGCIIERFIPWGRGRRRFDEVLEGEEWREMVKKLFNLFSIEEENSFLPYQAFQVSFHDEEPELLGAPCVIGKEGLCIMPNGEVFPCRRFPISIGNLLQTPFRKIWEESPLLNILRKKENLKGTCGMCPIETCFGCRSLAFALTGDYLAEHPHCVWFKSS